MDVVEQRIEDYWRTVTLPPQHLEGVRQVVLEHIKHVLPKQRAALEQAQSKVTTLEAQRQKLLQAQYNDAIPLDLPREEQTRIAAEMGRALEVMSSQQLSSARPT